MLSRLSMAVGAVIALCCAACLDPILPLAPSTQTDAGSSDAGDSGTPMSSFFFGTQGSEPTHAQDESNGGVKLAVLALEWKLYQPQSGQFDAAYIATKKAQLQMFQAAGRKVTLRFGVQDPPAWVFSVPNSRYVAENGMVSPQLNVVFNQSVRQLVEAYFARVQADFGLENFWAVQLNSGGHPELNFPEVDHYWAFDPNALNGAALPPSMPKNPAPSFKPGMTSVARAQVAQWASWYVGALANVVDWQMKALDALGFRGYYEIRTPGQGARPLEYEDEITQALPLPSLIAVGAVWHKVYEQIPKSPRVVVLIASLGDDSGEAGIRDGACEPTDTTIALSSETVVGWSSPRWIARVADEYGLAKSGENPGYGTPPSLNAHYVDLSEQGMMPVAFRQMQGCKLRAMYWAHSEQLWDGTVPFTQFAQRIQALNGSISYPPPTAP